MEFFAIILYIGLLAAYVIFIAPFVAAGWGLYHVGELIVRHCGQLHGVTRVRTAAYVTVPPHRPEDEDQPARRQYFLGPAQRDLRQLITLTWREGVRRTTDRGRWTYGRLLGEQGDEAVWRWPAGVTLQVGLIAGAAAGAAALALLLALHGLIVLLAAGLVLASAGVLRAVDFVALLAKKLHRGMLCPNQGCYERFSYPWYECRNAICLRRHTDIRPGRFGVLRRRCACGEELPTLILLMRGERRLQPFCPNCEQPMSRYTGHVAEAIIPFFGGQAAGKTQLMAAMMLLLENAAERGGRSLRAADDATQFNYDVLRETLRRQGHPTGTQRELPKAYSVVLREGRSERMLHLFDTAGERFTNREDTDALRYVQEARTFVFVLDPLAVNDFWRTPLAAAAGDIAHAIASSTPPDMVFNRSVDSMMQMGAPLKESRLAVAISKADLFGTEDLGDGGEWLDRALGLGNLVRVMNLEFGEVRYFFTGAVTTDETGAVHPSIAPLTDWCLRGRPA
ncbi:hypothetical protein G5C51_06515 [Streptomyces sp. A7024]|uniref:Double-GTPase 2 domain-containing protein n=1 Tax=Streptomyces coryli TaxID=1128680 RepID=A0A6G4TWR8_9ACTN|nr:hypothetical protein [Streptomyces coryli]NGN63558.1 hypothetical protein [Streptomyces coryli]